MNETRKLRDAYRQPGFVPQAVLRSVPFDPYAFGLALVRRRKKRFAECVVEHIEPSTISDRIGPATSIVPIVASSCSSSFEGSFVGAVAP